MRMNPRRDFRVAQQTLNEAIEEFLGPDKVSTRDDPDEQRLLIAWNDFDDARRNLEGAGAAGRRPTSIAAAHTDLPAKRTHRYDVIKHVVARHRFANTGMTTDEIEKLTGKSHQSISSAVNHCEAAGWIKDSGERRKTKFGREAIVYVPTDLAVSVMRTEVLG